MPNDPDFRPESSPDYDILQDEELMRLLEMDFTPPPNHSEVYVTDQEPVPPQPAPRQPDQPPAPPAEEPERRRKKPKPEPEREKKPKRKKAPKQDTADPAAPKQPRSVLWPAVMIACFYFELLLFFTTPTKSFSAFLAISFFTLAWAQGIYLVLKLTVKPVVQRILGGVLLGLGGFMVGLEYFLQATFQNFMDLSSILASAGDVAGSYSGSIWGIVFSGWWMIALCLLPLVLWIALRKKLPLRSASLFAKGKSGSRARLESALCLCLLLVAHLAALIVVLCAPTLRAGYGEQRTSMTFDKQVNSFGLMTAGRLDLRDRLFSTSTGFVIETQGTELPADPSDPTTAPDAPTVPGASEAPTEPTEPPKPITYHTMDIDFEALIPNAQESIASVHEYVNSLPLVPTNDYTGLFEGKNLILIAAESFSAEVIDPELTPTLYRLAHKGIEFKEFYQPAWGGSTSTGEYSILMGLVPTDGVSSMKDTVGHNLYLTMGNQLQRKGYFSRAYHNNSYDYYGRDLTHENFGYEKYIGLGNGMEEGVRRTWPESDVEMIDFTAPQYIDNQPFSIYYMTVSGHGDYQKTTNYMASKNFDATAGVNHSETVRCYLAAQLELEYAMADLVQKLEEAGIADDTVIVLTSDHYPYGLEPSDSWGNSEDYLAELYGYVDDTLPQQDHNALIIWSGCLEKMEPIVVDTPVYSLDILPTLSNLFGVEYDARLLIGRDVFSDAEPLVIWPNYSWKTEKGYYSAARGTFTPDDGVGEVTEDYISHIHSMVRNRISFSAAVLDHDYYGILFD